MPLSYEQCVKRLHEAASSMSYSAINSTSIACLASTHQYVGKYFVLIILIQRFRIITQFFAKMLDEGMMIFIHFVGRMKRHVSHSHHILGYTMCVKKNIPLSTHGYEVLSMPRMHHPL